MDQLTEFFVFQSTPEEASGIFTNWPAEMSFAVLADPAEGFTIALFHRDQHTSILERIARQRDLAPAAMRVIPEMDGYATLKIGVTRELQIQKMVEAEKDLPEQAGDYLLNYNCAKDLTPDEEYFGDDFADPDDASVVPDGPQEGHEKDHTDTPMPQTHQPWGYRTVDDSLDMSNVWAQDMFLDRTDTGRVLLATTSASDATRDAAEMVERLHLRVDGQGFFIAVDDLPELGAPCLEMPTGIASVFLDPASGRSTKMRVLVSDDGWHVTVVPTPLAPPSPAPAPVAPRPALTLPPVQNKPSMARVMATIASGAVLAVVLIALGAGAAIHFMPKPAEVIETQSPSLDDEDYLNLMRTRIIDKMAPEK